MVREVEGCLNGFHFNLSSLVLLIPDPDSILFPFSTSTNSLFCFALSDLLSFSLTD